MSNQIYIYILHPKKFSNLKLGSKYNFNFQESPIILFVLMILIMNLMSLDFIILQNLNYYYESSKNLTLFFDFCIFLVIFGKNPILLI